MNTVGCVFRRRNMLKELIQMSSVILNLLLAGQLAHSAVRRILIMRCYLFITVSKQRHTLTFTQMVMNVSERVSCWCTPAAHEYKRNQTWRYSASLWLVWTDERRWRAAEDDWMSSEEAWPVTGERERGARDCVFEGVSERRRDGSAAAAGFFIPWGSVSALYLERAALDTEEGRRSEVVNPLNPEENLPSQEGHQEEEASRSGLDKGCRI